MKGLFFWTFATLLLMTAVHIATVMMVPRLEGGERVAKAMNGGQLNRLTVLSTAEETRQTLGIANTDMVYAVCPFDITQRPMIISARVPSNYWSMSIYGEDGTALYTLNDKQAGVRAFTAELRLDAQGGLIPDDAVQGDTENLIIRSTTERGVIIFRNFAGVEAEHQRAREELAQTTCTTSRTAAALN